jgi:hypothetical protein
LSGEQEVLGHLESVQHLAHFQRNLGSQEWSPFPAGHFLGDPVQFLFGGPQQVRALPAALLRQQGIEAADQTLTRVPRGTDLGQIPLIAQGELQPSSGYQLPERRVQQGLDPTQFGILPESVDLGLGQHPIDDNRQGLQLLLTS